MPNADLTDFIAGLPKAELHVHHVGSASPPTVAELAARHAGSTSVPADVDALGRYFTFTDFAHFIEVYQSVAGLVRTPEDVWTLTHEVGRDLAAQQVRYAELVSFGLGGPELGVDRAQFQPYFDQARAAGLHSVPHAGESTGAPTVWDAIRLLGAERIGHGIRSVEDPELLAYLVEHAIALEVCPTSNVATRSVPSLAEHPLPALVAAGVTVSISSDDPSMFSTSLNGEYAVAARLLSLDAGGVAELARSAVRSSFATDAGKAALLAEIDDYKRDRNGPDQ